MVAKKNHFQKSKGNTKCATVAVTIISSGHMLTPVVVFKSAEHGRIEKEQFLTYPTNMVYQMQKNAWMDEQLVSILCVQ